MLTGLAIGIVGGLVIGYFVGAAHLFESDVAVGMPTPAAVPAAPIAGALDQLGSQQRINSAKAALEADPKNVQGWVALGNDYFDLHQAQNAVDAYGKALALSPNMPVAPDILTDQGIMFRELKEYDKAIANFKQANKLNPKHLQSLFNLGVVYAQDKNDKAKAMEVWNSIIALSPTDPQADLARKAIESLKGGAPAHP